MSCWDKKISIIIESSGKGEIGRKLLASLWSPLLIIGMKVARFHAQVNLPVTIEVLMMVVMYVMMTGRESCM